jgi:hypothetical protein
MEAGAASARGVRCAKARERAGKQNCCEKGLHISFGVLWRSAAADHDFKWCDSTTSNSGSASNIAEPNDGDLNAE